MQGILSASYYNQTSLATTSFKKILKRLINRFLLYQNTWTETPWKLGTTQNDLFLWHVSIHQYFQKPSLPLIFKLSPSFAWADVPGLHVHIQITDAISEHNCVSLLHSFILTVGKFHSPGLYCQEFTRNSSFITAEFRLHRKALCLGLILQGSSEFTWTERECGEGDCRTISFAIADFFPSPSSWSFSTGVARVDIWAHCVSLMLLNALEIVRMILIKSSFKCRPVLC